MFTGIFELLIEARCVYLAFFIYIVPNFLRKMKKTRKLKDVFDKFEAPGKSEIDTDIDSQLEYVKQLKLSYKNGHPSHTPGSLWDAFLEYMKWSSRSCWKKYEAIKSGDLAGTTIGVPKQRPLSIERFCVSAGICLETFYAYRNKRQPQGADEATKAAYSEVCNRIALIIRADQLDGAMVGAYHPGVSARILGLVTSEREDENKQVTVNLMLPENGRRKA